jgi:hypothetical protein
MTLYRARRNCHPRFRGTLNRDFGWPAQNLVANPSDPDRGHINLWRADAVPASNASDHNPAAGAPFALPPPKGGTLFRFFQIAPEENEVELSR